jgi:hypothetical protein
MGSTGKPGRKRAVKTFSMALGLVLALGAWQAPRAQMDMPFNADTEYQKNPHARVKRVLLYEYTFSSHNKAPVLDAMRRLSTRYGFRLDVSGAKDYITRETLDGVDVAVFANGSGDVLHNPISLSAMKEFVEVKGKGLLQIHEAAAYIPCPTAGQEILDDPDCNWLARVVARQVVQHTFDRIPARIYADSVLAGGVPPSAFSGTPVAAINHGRKNPETINIFKGLPKNGMGADPDQDYVWDATADEWFNYRGNPRLQGAQVFDGVAFGPVNILISLDESSFTPAPPAMGDHPMAWARKVGNGLTAFISAGHTDVYTRPRGAVKDSLIQKIDWNILRYLARDFVGCMDANKAGYNPEASVAVLTPGLDPADPCGPISNLRRIQGAADLGIFISGAGVVIPTIERRAYRIVASNAKGERVFSASLTGGPGQSITALENKKGTYFIEVTAPKTGKSVSKAILR